MAKVIPDAQIDLMLDQCEGVRVAVLSAEPANYAAIAGLTLAEETINSGHYAKANGDTSGRKNTLTPPAGTTIDVSGTATHVVVHDNTSVMLLVTTCTSQALTAGGGATVDIGAFDHEIADAA